MLKKKVNFKKTNFKLKNSTKQNLNLKNKIINNIIKNGNKRNCEKVLVKCLKNFQKVALKNYKNIIKLAIKNTTPIFLIKEVKKGKKKRRKEIKIPFIPKENIRITNTIKSIASESFKKKTAKNFYKSLTHELWLNARKKSEVLKKKTEMHEQTLKLKKRLARFRWF